MKTKMSKTKKAVTKAVKVKVAKSVTKPKIAKTRTKSVTKPKVVAAVSATSVGGKKTVDSTTAWAIRRNLKQIVIWGPEAVRDAIRTAADRAGMKMSTWILAAVDAKLGKSSGKVKTLAAEVVAAKKMKVKAAKTVAKKKKKAVKSKAVVEDAHDDIEDTEDIDSIEREDVADEAAA